MQREHNEFIAKLAGQQMDKIALDFHLLAFMVLFSLVLLMCGVSPSRIRRYCPILVNNDTTSPTMCDERIGEARVLSVHLLQACACILLAAH
jgi:hypothetical protein